MKLPHIGEVKESLVLRQELADKIKNMPKGHSLSVSDKLMAIAFRGIWVLEEVKWEAHPWAEPPISYISSVDLLKKFCRENDVMYTRQSNETIFTKKESE